MPLHTEPHSPLASSSSFIPEARPSHTLFLAFKIHHVHSAFSSFKSQLYALCTQLSTFSLTLSPVKTFFSVVAPSSVSEELTSRK